VIEFDFELARGGRRFAMKGRLEEPFTGVFGPSGAGKTTLLHVVTGLARPERGRVAIDGDVLFDSNCGVDRPAHRRALGLVFQEARLFPHLDVKGNLIYGAGRGASNGGARAGASELDAVVAALELATLLNARPNSLSGGERQRVAIGRALLAKPRALLLDEPFSGIDKARRRAILPFLTRVRTEWKVPLVVVSHDLADLLTLGERLLLIENGGVVASGPLAELAANPAAARLLHELGWMNVLRAEVVESGGEGKPARLKLPGGALLAAPPTDLLRGATVPIGLRPEDVALALAPVANTSIQNQIAGRIERIAESSERVICEIAVGAPPNQGAAISGAPLFVEISPAAVRALNLAPGRAVTCLFKTQALRYLA
jgi:molybdate transport system ATP-binding protein